MYRIMPPVSRRAAHVFALKELGDAEEKLSRLVLGESLALRARAMLTAELCWAPTRFSLAEILVLAGTAGAGGIVLPTSNLDLC